MLYSLFSQFQVEVWFLILLIFAYAYVLIECTYSYSHPHPISTDMTARTPGFRPLPPEPLHSPLPSLTHSPYLNWHDCSYPRVPSLPVAELVGHQAPLNGIAWAPHSPSHICTISDDKHVRTTLPFFSSLLYSFNYSIYYTFKMHNKTFEYMIFVILFFFIFYQFLPRTDFDKNNKFWFRNLNIEEEKIFLNSNFW